METPGAVDSISATERTSPPNSAVSMTVAAVAGARGEPPERAPCTSMVSPGSCARAIGAATIAKDSR